MGTRKKTKERVGGCQALWHVVWRARRRDTNGCWARKVLCRRGEHHNGARPRKEDYAARRGGCGWGRPLRRPSGMTLREPQHAGL